MKFTYIHQEGQPFELSAFQNAGLGLSYQHFINNEGTSYNDFGVSALFLFRAIAGETTNADLSLQGRLISGSMSMSGQVMTSQIKKYSS